MEPYSLSVYRRSTPIAVLYEKHQVAQAHGAGEFPHPFPRWKKTSVFGQIVNTFHVDILNGRKSVNLTGPF